MQIDSDDAVFHFAGENTRSTRNAELCAIVQCSPDLLSLLEEYGGNSPLHRGRERAAGSPLYVGVAAREKTMPKVDTFGQQNGNCAPFTLDRPRMERAIAELVTFAAGVGLSGGDLIQLLDSGMGMSEILKILEEKAKRRVH